MAGAKQAPLDNTTVEHILLASVMSGFGREWNANQSPASGEMTDSFGR